MEIQICLSVFKENIVHKYNDFKTLRVILNYYYILKK